MSRGSPTLADYPTSMVHLVCPKCGRLSRARLIREHGADANLPGLRHILARRHRALPKDLPRDTNDPCGVKYADLRDAV
jgi:hypothetical protein